MSRRSTCPRPDDLFAFRDGVLSDVRQREIGEHLKHCLPCLRQLRGSDEIGRLLRATIPLVDDPLGRARLKARLRANTEPAPTCAIPNWTISYRLLAASLAVLVILGSSLIWSGELQGGSSFTRWWRDDTLNQVIPASRVQQTPATAPHSVIAPPSLPFDLALTEGGRVNTAGYGEHFYRNDTGLAVRVAVDPPGVGWLPTSDVDDRQDLIGVDGRDLVIMYGVDQDDVLSLFWIEDGSLHTLSVVESPPGGLPRDDALTIVAALMDIE